MRHLIFDMDGLLVDSEPVHRKAWGLIFEKHGLVMTDELFMQFVGTSNDYVASWMQKRGAKADKEEMISEKKARFRELIPEVPLRLGAKEFIAKLNNPMSVASSTPKDIVESMLEATGIRELFTHVTGGDEVEHAKPAPDVYLLAAERAGVRPSECIAFEDSGHGCDAAHAAGMPCIALPSAYSKGQDFSNSSRLVRSFDELDPEEFVG